MISDRRATRANYDRLSRWYDLIGGSSERPARERGIEALDIQPGERALEIGCGTGQSLPMLASAAGEAGRVVGLDLSAGMLRVARKRGARIHLAQGDGTRLPFASETFDALFLSFTLELFPPAEIPILLEECRRALRPGGRLGAVSLLQKDAPGWMERAYRWARRRWPRLIDCRPIPLEKLIEEAGWEVSRITSLSMWGLKVGIVVAVNSFGSGRRI
ncbi:MAG: methyltransferase domain-containing protein [Chloroflexota bacterium]